MGISADEYAKFLETRPGPKTDPAKSDKIKFRTMLHDVVAAEQLTTDKHWDQYLEWLSGARGMAVRNAEYYSRILTNSDIVSHDALIKAKIGVANCEAVRETLEWCMEIPVQLKDGAKEVRKLLKLATEKEDDADHS